MLRIHYLLLLTVIFVKISFAIEEPLFYLEDFHLSQPKSKLFAGVFCKLCDTLLDFLENKLPLKTLGKGPMMLAIRAACTATSMGNPLWIMGCPVLGEQLADFILNGGSPDEACKSVGICPC